MMIQLCIGHSHVTSADRTSIESAKSGKYIKTVLAKNETEYVRCVGSMIINDTKSNFILNLLCQKSLKDLNNFE